MAGTLIPEHISQRVGDLIGQLTLEEKAALSVGADFWSTVPIERLGIPAIWMTDGPTGVRRAATTEGAGIGNSVPATCFPTASALASSWDVEAVREVGEAIGLEAQAQGVQILLGPGVNLKRSPLAGRNFEYFSEDPVLSGAMAAAFISGVQSQGVGTSLKHFAANEQESGRMYIDSVVDQRTLREVYLRPFEIAIREASPWTLMCAYNLLNGTACAEHRELLVTILRDEWGHEGFVMSDWGAVNDRAASIAGGLDLQMPGARTAGSVVEAVQAGSLDESLLDEVVADLLGIILLAHESIRPDTTFDADAHHALARRVAAESMVLLRNEGNLLPLDPASTAGIVVIGRFATEPRFQGAGSSQVNPISVTTLADALPGALPDASLTFVEGYDKDGNALPGGLDAAAKAAAEAEVAIVVIGLPSAMETEGRDRETIDLPSTHNGLVDAVLKAQPNTIVVVINGSAVAMPWAGRVPAILEAWLGGQAGGGAIADVLTGVTNPSGKLSETFPRRIEDTPAYLNFPHDGDGSVRFAERVFTGHRWYDARGIAPLFPFGHGLSYTTFQLDGLTIEIDAFKEGGPVEVSAVVCNTGERAGKQVVQLYVGECHPTVPRPKRELRAFTKVDLQPGEEECVQFSLHWRDFAWWDVRNETWVMNPGEYEICIGDSSANLTLTARVNLPSNHAPVIPLGRKTPLAVALQDPVAGPAMQQIVDGLRAHFGEGEGADTLMLFMMDSPIGKFATMGFLNDEALDSLIAEANS